MRTIVRTPHQRAHAGYQIDHLGFDARRVLRAAEAGLLCAATPSDCLRFLVSYDSHDSSSG